jgi:FtsP/CotA-like multicopper oxidase with cupredoxin domain
MILGATVGAGALAGVGIAAGGRMPETTPAAAEAQLRVDTTPGQPLVEPPVVRARDHVASIDLTAKATRITAGVNAVFTPWNGMMPSPTLELDPGDQLRIKLDNQNPYGEPTNIHVHGMHVSPKPPGDDVFLNIPTGSSYQYRYPVPKDHVPGMYWYHPHRHEYTQTQVFGGQAGAIIVRGGLDDVPGVGDVRDRIMVFQATQVNDQDRVIRTPSNSAPRRQLQLINGQLRPTIDMRPGETQRWRILNGSSDKFLVLRLQGHPMYLIANDGNPMATPIRTETQFIGPGERREFLVRAGARRGRFDVQSMNFVPVTKQPSYSAPTRVVGTVVVKGAPVTPRPLPEKLVKVEDLRDPGVRIARRRTVVLSEGFDPGPPPVPSFFINGKEFDPKRIDETMKLNTVEEWTIRNVTDEWHTFHIHINPYQVIRINGKRVKPVLWDDNVTIGPNGGTITYRTRFTDFTGKFVMHCHVLFHEDKGMMSAVQIVK